LQILHLIPLKTINIVSFNKLSNFRQGRFLVLTYTVDLHSVQPVIHILAAAANSYHETHGITQKNAEFETNHIPLSILTSKVSEGHHKVARTMETEEQLEKVSKEGDENSKVELDRVEQKSRRLVWEHTHTHTHNRFMALRYFVQDYPGEPTLERYQQEGKTNLHLLEQEKVSGSGIS